MTDHTIYHTDLQENVNKKYLTYADDVRNFGNSRWLNFDDIKGNNISTDHIKSDLVLPLYDECGNLIYWETSNPKFLLENGVVTNYTKKKQKVTLTAKLNYGAGKVSENKIELTLEPEANHGLNRGLHILQIGDSNTQFARITRGMAQILETKYGDYGIGFITLCKDYVHIDNIYPKNLSINYNGDWKQYDLVHGEGELCKAEESPFGLYVQGDYADDIIEIDFAGSAAALYYPENPGGGCFEVFIDGESKGVISQNKIVRKTEKKVYEGMDYGLHKMVLKNISGTVRFFGIDYYLAGAGSKRANISTWGKAGIEAKQYAEQLAPVYFTSGLRAINPDVTVILIGTNDNGLSGTVSVQFKVYLDTMILRVKESIPYTEIWLVSTFETFNPISTLKSYWQEAFPNAARNNNVKYWNMGEWFGKFSNKYMFDGWHSNTEGSKKIAEKMLKVILNGKDVPGRNIKKTVDPEPFFARPGTKFEDLKLPEHVKVRLDDMQKSWYYVDVKWDKAAYRSKKGSYTLIGQIESSNSDRIYNQYGLTANIQVNLDENSKVTDYKVLSYRLKEEKDNFPGKRKAYTRIPRGIFLEYGEITLCLKVKLRDIADRMTLFEIGSDEKNYGILTVKGTVDGAMCGLMMSIQNNGKEYSVMTEAEKSVPVGQTVHIGYTQRNSVGVLYMDGKQMARCDDMRHSLSDVAEDDKTMAVIGASMLFPHPPVNGKVELLEVYSKALSAEEVLALYLQERRV